MRNEVGLVLFVGALVAAFVGAALLVSCSAESRARQEAGVLEHWRSNWPRCDSLLDVARTWSDTMTVYAMRPGATNLGSPTCFELRPR